MAMFDKGDYLIPFSINQTDLLAGGDFSYFSSPIDGYIEEFEVVVKTAVTTGGTLQPKLGTTVVAGLQLTVANAAPAFTVYNAKTTLGEIAKKLTSTAKVTKGQAIKIAVDAAFATAGEVSGWVRITGAPVGG